MDKTRDQPLTKRLVQAYDPVIDRERREAYLRRKRLKMPTLVEHQERMRDGMTGRDSVLLDLAAGRLG